jgi:iron complex transport system substrate-binding protein
VNRRVEALLAVCTLSLSIAGTRALVPATLRDEAVPSSRTVFDASGAAFSSGSRHCIASASTVADRLIVALAGAESLCAVASAATCVRPWCLALQGKPRVASLDDVSALAALRADLIVTANPGAPARLLRLREAGLPVFDMGPSAGIEALHDATTRIGALLDRDAAAASFWSRFARRMATIADPSKPRPRALYLALYGSFLAGGARDTSWHDVIESGGLTDAASDRVGWPSWTAIDVAERNPAWIVTERGMGTLLCNREGIAGTEACQSGRVAEIDGDLLSDPGPTMLDAAEALADRIAELSATR